MGWDWTFDFEFEHGYPSAKALEQLFTAVATSAQSDCIPNFEIQVSGEQVDRTGNRQSLVTKKYEDLEIDKAVEMTLALGDNLEAKSLYTGTRMRMNETQPSHVLHRLIIFSQWRFHLRMPEVAWYPAVRYDAGRGDNYNPRGYTYSKQLKKAAQYNLSEVRREVTAMFAAVPQAARIRGGDNAYDDPFADTYRLQRSFGQFLTDIGQPADMLSDEAVFDIMMAYQNIDPDFTVELHPSGVEVYFKNKGSYGGLRQFYDFLRQQVSGQT